MRRLLRLTRPRQTIDAEIDEELWFHFDRSVEDLVRAGLSPSAARRESLRRFGDVHRHRYDIESIDRKRAAMERRTEWVDVIRQNLRYAFRSVKRAPGFTFAIVVTLGLGIGANATMFGVIDRILLRPPMHITNPEQVRKIFVNSTFFGRPITSQGITYPDFKDFDAAESFAATAVYSGVLSQTMGRGESATRVQTASASASLYSLLGVRPAFGRFYTDEEDQPGQPGRAVLSRGLWQSQFGGADDVLGLTVRVGKVDYTVVGVAPIGFTGAELEPVDVWLSLHARPDGERWRTSRGFIWLRSVVRLRPGVTVEAAEAEATTISRVASADPSSSGPDTATITAASLIAAQGPNASDESAVSRWLAGVSLIVLLIACANVANLLLAKGVRARRELAIRLALGVSRSRLVAQLLTESVVLAAMGGVVALAIARWGGELMRTVLVPGVAWPESPVNGRVLIFTMAATVLTGLIAGLMPALQSSRPNLAGALKQGHSDGAIRHSMTRNSFLVVQGALSVVLLVGAGLFVRSLARIQSLDVGMDADHILTVTLDIDGGGTAADQVQPRASQIWMRGLDRLRNKPGIRSVSAANSLQFRSSTGLDLAVSGRDSLPRVPTGGPYFNSVTADYFNTMGMTLLRGRGFTETDHRGNAPRVAVVDETMARLIWPNEEALGQCLMIGQGAPPCSEIVGVVRDSRRQELIEGETMQYFVPWESHPVVQGELTTLEALFVRSAGEPAQLAETVRGIVQLDPAIKFVNVRPLQELIDPQRRSWKLGATMFTVFGALALVVAGIGLYSVLAFGVAQRTHELGVRAALGATSQRLIALVFAEGIRFTAIGVGLGTVVALLAGSAVAPLLFDVSPRDPVVFGVVVVTLGAVAVLASVIPAWRAARIDPNQALRTE